MSGQYTQGQDKTFTADEAISADHLVALNLDTSATPHGVEMCEPHMRVVGVARAAVASASLVDVRIPTRYASLRMTAGAAISKGAKVYPGLAGKVYAYGIQGSIGRALEAASGSGSVIEVMWDPMSAYDDDDLSIFRLDPSHYVDADQVTVVATNSGTLAIGDGYPAAFAVTCSDGSVADNDETYAKGTTEMFKFTVSKPIYFKCRLKHTEQATDDANLIIGLTDGVAANLVLDNGAGLKASGSTFGFMKVDGGTTWTGVIQDSTNDTADSNVGALSGGSWQILEGVWWPTSATAFTCQYFIDGVDGGSIDGGSGETVTDYTSATDMEIVFGAKNGDTNNEVLYVSLFEARQFVG